MSLFQEHSDNQVVITLPEVTADRFLPMHEVSPCFDAAFDQWVANEQYRVPNVGF
jgi:hypothetical protein